MVFNFSTSSGAHIGAKNYQKAMPQPVLKQFDLLANCTLRHVYFFGGVPEFAQPNNRFESAQGALR